MKIKKVLQGRPINISIGIFFKGVFIAIALIWGGGAHGEWLIAGHGADNLSYYTDVSTRQQSAGNARIWTLFDYASSQGGDDGIPSHRSYRALYEYKCRERLARVLSFSYHSQNMAQGKVLLSESTASTWEFVAPGTVDESLLAVACQRWIKLSEDNQSTTFADVGNLKRYGDKARIAVVVNLKPGAKDGKGKPYTYVSWEDVSEYDCKAHKSRTVEGFWYDQTMAEGKLVDAIHLEDQPQWNDIVPNSPGFRSWSAACGVKEQQ